MNKLAKTILTHAAVAYLAVGVALGSLLWASIPAVNVAGWTYYTATWPVFICYGTKVCTGTPYIPNWVFTFPAPKEPEHG